MCESEEEEVILIVFEKGLMEEVVVFGLRDDGFLMSGDE